MGSRRADPDDVEHVARTITLAFATDPVWAVALRRDDGRTDHHEPYWRLFVDGAMRYGTARISEDGGAVSIWIPPGGTELTDVGEATLDAMIDAVLDPASAIAMRELYRRFEASRADRPEHYYLSLLATHPDHRGRGVGQRLLADDLQVWDSEGVPAYLESTNHLNDHRYERAGFVADGGFSAVLDGTWITAMWRPVGGASRPPSPRT
jgi:GNAT superfamily N-acetyltransferase